MSLTVEQLEEARAERMRQNGHGATTIEDVRTWIEETGLCIFLPRSAQAGLQAGSQFSTATPTFVEAVAGQRTTEPTLELIATAEALLVRLEAEGVAVRLNLAGQPGDQPDYVVAGWVLPYIYALRGDRDWRRSPQLTGSRQVSQLAVQAAKQIDSANMTAGQIRDALGREVTETAVLRALHELWKQLRIIPVVPEVGSPALWQPLRQRFQKAIAEGASTSQVTAISVLASIYLQAVIAGSMEDVELFLSPLTARSKIREVVRGLAATRQVHSTTLNQSPMFYVAGTLPEFPAVPSFQISNGYTPYRNSNYRGATGLSNRGSAYLASYLGQNQEDEFAEAAPVFLPSASEDVVEQLAASASIAPEQEVVKPAAPVQRKAPARPAAASPAKPAQPRPRSVGPVHPREPRERSRSAAAGSESRPSAGSDRRRAPAPRGAGANGSRSTNSNGAGSRPAARPGSSFSNGNGSHAKAANGSANGSGHGTANGSGNGTRPGSKPTSRSNARPNSSMDARPANGAATKSNGNGAYGKPKSTSTGSSSKSRPTAGKPAASSARASAGKPSAASAAKRYSFSGQAKQAPKPVAKAAGKPAVASARPASAKRRG